MTIVLLIVLFSRFGYCFNNTYITYLEEAPGDRKPPTGHLIHPAKLLLLALSTAAKIPLQFLVPVLFRITNKTTVCCQ